MRAIGLALVLLSFTILAGCNSNRAAAPAEPLTIEAWTALAPETKYEVATLERLKQDNTKFHVESEWNRFTRTVIIPGRKKELPRGLPGK